MNTATTARTHTHRFGRTTASPMPAASSNSGRQCAMRTWRLPKTAAICNTPHSNRTQKCRSSGRTRRRVDTTRQVQGHLTSTAHSAAAVSTRNWPGNARTNLPRICHNNWRTQGWPPHMVWLPINLLNHYATGNSSYNATSRTTEQHYEIKLLRLQF